jgi:hypothetical protein
MFGSPGREETRRTINKIVQSMADAMAGINTNVGQLPSGSGG